MADLSGEEIRVTVPARPEFVQILRLVIRGVAARVGMGFDTIDDLALAVDESCAQLLALGPTKLTLVAMARPESVEVSAHADAVGANWPPENLELTFGWRILKSLADEVHFVSDHQGAGVKLLKRAVEGAAG